jgi:pimeloyl-ACP methyl ester carboxylesterase
MKGQIAGGELAYDVRGSGPVLLLLHAFPFDRRMWSEELARLSDARRVIAVDLRGFGESPAWGEPTIDDLADDVDRLLDVLGIPMAALLGLSMGGYVALAFAARHRGRLSALILADTRAAADSDVARAARQATMRQVRQDGPAAFLDGVAERLLSRHASEDLRARVRGLCVDRAEAILAGTRALAGRSDRTSLLPAIDVPTLVVCGGEDTTSPAPEMRNLAQAIPGAEYVEIAGAGHLSNLESPGRFDDAVGRFLAAHDL